MRTARTGTSIVLITCTLLAGAVASADTMTITYRSGKVQKVEMNEPSAEVQGISYQRSSGPASEIKAKDSMQKPAVAGEGGQTDSQPGAKKTGVTIKWAPPIDQ